MRFRITAAILTVLMGLAARADACSVPVFRYALERWEPSPYELVVFHRGELPADAKKLVENVNGRAEQVNLVISLADLDKADLRDDWQSLWTKHGKESSQPWAVLRTPGAKPNAEPIWTGPFDTESLKTVTQSPGRAELAKRLCSGQSTVFVLVKSGDAEADAKVAKMLAAKLEELEKSLKLAEQDPDAPGPKALSPLPLRIKFSVLELDREDAKEAVLIRSLFLGESKLAEVKGPVALPVFGRGRALAALHGDLLLPEVVEEVGQFLCGDCSCTVKDLNPGWDLPFDHDWQAAVFPER